MITLDDVNRIKAILISYGEWLECDEERFRVDEDGVFEWWTGSCGGEAIRALVDAGFDVFIFGSLSHGGYVEFRVR